MLKYVYDYQNVIKYAGINIQWSSVHERKEKLIHERADIRGRRQPIEQHVDCDRHIFLMIE